MNNRIKKRTTTPIQLSKIGSIRIGEKSKTANGKEYPKSLDYFIPKCENKAYENDFKQVWGETPQTLRIYFLSEDLGEISQNTLELRDSSGRLVASGDGENFNIATSDGKGGAFFDYWSLERIKGDSKLGSPEILMDKMKARYNTEWRETLRLRFMVADVKILGYWELTTYASNSSIPQILGCIDAVQKACGKIAGIPFDLCVKKHTNQKAGAKNSYPVLALYCNATDSAQQEAVQLQQGLINSLNGTHLLDSPK